MTGGATLPPWLRPLLDRLTTDERQGLRQFLEALLRIRHSEASRKEKLSQTLEVAKQSSSLAPVIREIWRAGKKHTWDDRGSGMRWGMAGAGAGLLLFGGASVGVAGFGGAIALPLWIVFGAGAALAHGIIADLGRTRD
jgi:hypothetical protein